MAKAYNAQELALYRLTAKASWPYAKNPNEQRRFERDVSIALSNRYNCTAVALISEPGSIILDILANTQIWAAATMVFVVGVQYEVIPLPIPPELKSLLLFGLGHLATMLSPEVAAATKTKVESVAKEFKAWKATQAAQVATDEFREQWKKAREHKEIKKAMKESNKRKSPSSSSKKKKPSEKNTKQAAEADLPGDEDEANDDESITSTRVALRTPAAAAAAASTTSSKKKKKQRV